MKTVNVAEAKATLSELLRLVEHGESVTIAQRGRPVAQLVPLEPKKVPLDLEAWARIAAAAGPQEESTESFMRRMRDSDRY